MTTYSEQTNEPCDAGGLLGFKTRYVIREEVFVGDRRIELVDDAGLIVKAWHTEGHPMRVVTDSHLDNRPDLTFVHTESIGV